MCVCVCVCVCVSVSVCVCLRTIEVYVTYCACPQGLEQEGLYRLPGVKSLVQNLKDAYDRGGVQH